MGFSLDEIRGLYEDETHVPGIDALEEKIRLCEEELRLLKARKAQLQAMVTSQKKHRKMEKITFEHLPAITVASHRTTIHSFEGLGPLCYQVIGPEMARLYQNYIDLFAWMEKEGWTLASILGKVCKKVADLHHPIGHRRTLKCICLGKVCSNTADLPQKPARPSPPII